MHKLSTIKEYAQANLGGRHPNTLREAIEIAIETLDAEAAEYAKEVEADERAERVRDEWNDNYGRNLEMSNYELY